MAEFNDSQLLAIKSVKGPVMVTAGPGSGKTTVITGRLTHMLKDCGVDPSSVLVITFTRAAALEMHERYKKLPGYSDKVTFGTFHGIFYRILSDYYGYTKNNILSGDTGYKLLSSCLKEEHAIIKANPDYLVYLAGEISAVKMKKMNPGEFCSSLLSPEDFSYIYNAYTALLKEKGYIDFEDMLIYTKELFEKEPRVLKKWQEKFGYILVDEFQDINPIQYEITKMLAAPENNLFVVGDDDQSIYAFRGAEPGIMQKFPEDFPGCAVINLNVNYRSTPQILKASGKLIKHNKLRYDKELLPSRGSGENVTVKIFPQMREQYSWLADEVEKKIRTGVSKKDIAILIRTNAQANAVAPVFLRHDIPLKYKGHLPSLYENRYIKPLIAYLKYACGDRSRGTFMKFANAPVRYIEHASLYKDEIDINELIEYYRSEKKGYVIEKLVVLKRDIKALTKLDAAGSIKYIRKAMKYDEYVRQELLKSGGIYDDVMDRLDVFESMAEKGKLYFLAAIAEDEKRIKDADFFAEDAVNLLTYHGAKGLEFDTVFLIDCIEGLTPYKKAKEKAALEEERRMFYVAMTRAKNKLVITSAKARHAWRDAEVSRFVKELIGK